MTLNKIFTEYTISVKDEKSSLSEKDFTYQPLEISKENEMLVQRISAVIERFIEKNPSQESPEVVIRTKTVWQP
jgi:hypothetical protein